MIIMRLRSLMNGLLNVGEIMGIGRTIRVYLDDGSITGIRHAEIVNWTGQALSSPRNQVKSLSEWEESIKPGVYFLFGVDEETGGPAVYIGEAENVYRRLQQHLTDPDKDFWNEVVLFTSKDENLTKSHVKYLESQLVLLVKSASRYALLNGNEPKTPTLPRGDRDAMEEFIQNLRVLLGVIGHKALEPFSSNESKDKGGEQLSSKALAIFESQYFLKVKSAKANAIVTNEGIVVLTGSEVSKNIKDSLSFGYKKLREQLIASSVIVEDGDKLVFSKDQLFTSPSQAGAIIVGYAINGRRYWQNNEGISLKDIEETND